MAEFIITCPSCNHQFEPGKSIQEEVEKKLRGQMQDWQKRKDEEFKQKETAFQQQLKTKDQETAKLLETEKRNCRKNYRKAYAVQ